MDPQTNRATMNRLLATDGQGYFFETEFNTAEPTSNEIQVKSVLTGVCRSDIDMMLGNFGPLPLSMQGHEGLGEVIAIGNNVTDVQVGDFVATRGEPAYADIYNAKHREYVKVPTADPKYILEPVACGVNIIIQPLEQLIARSGDSKRLLILGSGFLAWIAYNTIKIKELEFDIDVVGRSNTELWGDILKTNYSGEYDVVIDLSSHDYVFKDSILNNEALVVFGVQKDTQTDFSNLLWKACTMVFPSPRTEKFYDCMKYAAEWIQENKLKVDNFWTKGYNRETQWEDAFQDSINRIPGFSRAYIDWRV